MNDIECSKRKLRSKISKITEEKLVETISFNGNSIELTERNKAAILTRTYYILTTVGEITTTWQFDSGYITLTRAQFLDFSNFISNYIESCFAVEESAVNRLNECDSIVDLEEFSLNFYWPRTSN